LASTFRYPLADLFGYAFEHLLPIAGRRLQRVIAGPDLCSRNRSALPIRDDGLIEGFRLSSRLLRNLLLDVLALLLSLLPKTRQ
jgi:hypothetical protein